MRTSHIRALEICALLVLIVSLGASVIHADNCAVQVDSVSAPSDVYAGSNFDVRATVTTTCQVAGNYLSGQATLVDSESNLIDSKSFIIGFIHPITPSSVTSVVKLHVQHVPMMQGPWMLRILIDVYGYASQGIVTSTQRDFSIQVLQVSQEQTATTELPILLNGGFESGLDNWERVQGLGGFISLTSRVVHSGSSAVAIAIAPPRPGSNVLVAMTEGVSQSVTVNDMRGLKVEASYLLQSTTYLMAARMRIVLSDITINYYVAASPYTGFAPTSKTRSIFLSPTGCNPWCTVAADVGSDVLSHFDSGTFARVLQGVGPIQIVVALEFLLYAGTTSTQFMYWDDVAATASVPSQTISTTLTLASSSISSASTVSTSFLSSEAASEVTTTSTITETVGFLMSREQIYLGTTVVLAFALILALLAYQRRKKHQK